MSSDAIGTTSASVFEDEVKAAMRGDYIFKSSSAATGSHKWLFSSAQINANAAILGTANDYMSDGVAAATGDIAKWIAIKNTGTTDGETVTTDGIVVLPTNTTVAYNTVGGIFVAPGEMAVLKMPFTTINTIGAVSVSIVNGMPTADSSNPVLVKIAALMDDVG
tara:strand:- start:353 stop:844 length:492 start_codon:yes stop_codon:yes gene_type:complete